MRSNFVSFVAAALILAHQVFATGLGRGESSQTHLHLNDANYHPPLIDFFAQEGRPTSGHRNSDTNQRGKQIREQSPDLDLSLDIPGNSQMQTSSVTAEIGGISEKRLKKKVVGGQRRYNKYRWQQNLDNDTQVDELYRIIGDRYRPMARSTVINVIDRIDLYLEQHPYLVELIQKRDKKAIEEVTKKAGPLRHLSRYHKAWTLNPKEPQRVTMADFLDRRNAWPLLVSGMHGFKEGERVPPKWAAGLDIDQKGRRKLIYRLSNEWLIAPDTVKSRLYHIDRNRIQKYAKGVLNDDPNIYKEQARLLLPLEKYVYPYARPDGTRPLSLDTAKSVPRKNEQEFHHQD